MRKQRNSTRRQFLGLAGGAAALSAVPIVTVRPADATPAMLAAAIRNVVGEAEVRIGTSSTRRTRSRMSAISISARTPAARRFRPAFASPTARRSSPSRGCPTIRSGRQASTSSSRSPPAPKR